MAKTMFLRALALACILLGAASAVRAQVVINEIHYNPDVKTEPVEFVELHNTGTTAQALDGWRLASGLDFVFPAGTSLGPEGYVVVAADPAALKAKYGANSLGPWTGKLSNERDSVVLKDAAGTTRDRVDYQAGFPWPTVGDAPGYSMELIHPSLERNLGGSWRSSSVGGGEASSTVLVSAGAPWSYLKGTKEASNPTDAWRQPGFVETGWSLGALPVGYGENFIVTSLDDMRNTYGSVFFRRHFNVQDPAAFGELLLEAQYDDGYNLWINGKLMKSSNLPGTELPYSAFANSARESLDFEQSALPAPANILVKGDNVIAVQAHNSSLANSSDFFLDVRLTGRTGGSAQHGPTPGARNSVYATNAAPQVRQVENTPSQPKSGDAVLVTAKVTDPDGVAEVLLQYQVVEPGAYIQLDDPAYQTTWKDLAMNDRGQDGDALAGDQLYTARIPASEQLHRRLIRYRVTATDSRGAKVRAPYSDDPQPNFAYFVYDGVPDWSGAIQPGSTDAVKGRKMVYDTNVMNRLPVYHLISKKKSVEDSTWNERYDGDLYKWSGTLVYEGKVYDHIHYRSRGGVWRYAMGKNMWKFDFNRGHAFEPRDNFGRKYDVPWNKLNLGACIQQGDFQHRGEQGMFESVGFRLFNLAGVESPNTQFVQFRVINEAAESDPANQFRGDFWGLYLGIEQEDGKFLDAHNLPDGNLYKMEGGTGTLNNQGSTAVSDRSDLNKFLSTYTGTKPADEWWRANLDLGRYYSYRTIVEAIHHYDIDQGAGKNYFYYLNPEENLWSVHSWDLDLTWADNMYGGGDEPFRSRVLASTRPTFVLEYANRIRELRDLLYNPDEAGRLIDEQAAMIYNPTGPSFVDADRARWDYNPLMISSLVNASKAGQGRFYQKASTKNFPGMVQIMKNYVVTRGTFLDNLARDAAAPATPTVTYAGKAGFPINGLRFRVSDYAGANAFAAIKWRVGEVIPRTRAPYIKGEPQKYEIEPLWETPESASFVSETTIPAEALRVGHTYRARARMKDATGRWSRWSAAVEFVAGASDNATALREHLRVSELMYNPAVEPDFEFIELHNTSATLTLDLGGVAFTQGINHTFANGVTLPPGGYLLVAKSDAAGNFASFRAFYGLSANVPVVGPYAGSFSNDGEQVVLKTSAGADEILSFEYGDGRNWPVAADGAGHSLVPMAANYDQQATGVLNDGRAWRASARIKGSPGAADLEPTDTVVLNEITAHTDIIDPAHPGYDSNDWLEVYNPSGAPVDISGWYLSDDPSNLKKWAVPAGSVVLSKVWLSFDEVSGFHNPITSGFGLDKAGEQVLLSFLPGTGGDRVVDAIQFKGQQNGVSWARFPDGGTWGPGVPTRDRANVAVEPALVISEVHHHPAPTLAHPEDNVADEFIEIANPGAEAVRLFDTNGVWRIDGGVQFVFPTNTTLAAGASLLVLNFNPTNAAMVAEFAKTFPKGKTGAVLFGPFSGHLKNSSDRVGLEKPQYPDAPSTVYSWIVVDEVNYADQGTWPATADGGGDSLQRIDFKKFGNVPGNWSAGTPTPGLATEAAGDSDGDGMPDDWERRYGFDPSSALDAALDRDGDGLSNLQEYLAGTDPTSAQSALQWSSAALRDGSMMLAFQAVVGRAYTVEYSSALSSAGWQTLREFAPGASDQQVEFTESIGASDGQRYYRLRLKP